MNTLRIFAIAICGLGLLLPGVGFADMHVVVVLDDSGSMDETMRTESGRSRRIDAAKTALMAVLNNLPSGTQVGVLALNTSVDGSNWIIPLGPPNPAMWQRSIGQIRAEGGTPLGEFLKTGTDALLEARNKNIYGEYRLLVVTDGEANDSELVDAYLPDILSRGVVTDVIGVDMESDHSLATKVHNYRRADDGASLQEAIAETFAETDAPTDENAESDFDLIAGLPDEVAAEAVKALARLRDDPIEGDFSAASSSSRGFRSSSSGSSGGVVEAVFGSMICCFGIFAVLIVLITLVFQVRKPPRRRF